MNAVNPEEVMEQISRMAGQILCKLYIRQQDLLGSSILFLIKSSFGGGVGTGLQNLLLPRIRDYVKANVFALHQQNLSIEATSLGEDIVLLGCAALVLADCKIQSGRRE